MHETFLILNDDKQAQAVTKTAYLKIMKLRSRGYEKARRSRLLFFPKRAKSYLSYLKKESRKNDQNGFYKSWVKIYNKNKNDK